MSKIKRPHINPILKKELVVNSRNMKMSWAIFGLNAFLSVVALTTMYALELSSADGGYNYSSLVSLFPILGVLECVILSFAIPTMTSGSISGERERQTLDIMLTTPVKPFSIALGKLESALVLVMMYMVSSIPVLSIAFILGGLDWSLLLGLLVMMLYLGIYVGSVGIFCSSIVKKTVAASMLTMLIGIAVIILTVMVYSSVVSLKYSLNVVNNGVYELYVVYEPIILMFNPYAPVVDFFLQSFSSISVYDLINAYAPAGGLGNVMTFIYKHWMLFTGALNLLVSLGFLKLASLNIAATRRRKPKKAKA